MAHLTEAPARVTRATDLPFPIAHAETHSGSGIGLCGTHVYGDQAPAHAERCVVCFELIDGMYDERTDR